MVTTIFVARHLLCCYAWASAEMDVPFSEGRTRRNCEGRLGNAPDIPRPLYYCHSRHHHIMKIRKNDRYHFSIFSIVVIIISSSMITSKQHHHCCRRRHYQVAAFTVFTQASPPRNALAPVAPKLRPMIRIFVWCIAYVRNGLMHARASIYLHRAACCARSAAQHARRTRVANQAKNRSQKSRLESKGGKVGVRPRCWRWGCM